ncbi:MAG: NHL repeat-containing protein [Myxococcales bacterium]
MKHRQLCAAFVLLALGACTQGYAVVNVDELDAGRLPAVYQIRSTATDGTSQSTALGPLEGNPISFPKSYVIKLPPAATSLQVLVEGLDTNGNTALRGLSQPTGFKAGASDVAVAVHLTQACGSGLDCPADEVCGGSSACQPTPFVADAGACISVSPAAPPGFGTPCGASGGRCDAEAVPACIAPWRFCGDGNADGGAVHLPDGGLLVRQCDWGTPPQPCTGPGGACNENAADHCHLDCSAPSCGDGNVDKSLGEVCDLGADNGKEMGCNATCTLIGDAGLIAGNGDVYPDGGLCVPNPGCLADGPGADAMFDKVGGLAILGHTLYVGDSANQVVRSIDLSSPQFTVATVAGNPTSGPGNQVGQGGDAGFAYPNALLSFQGEILVGTFSNVATLTPEGVVGVLAGQNGGISTGEGDGPFLGSTTKFSSVSAIAYDGNDNLYTADSATGAVRWLELDAGVVSHVIAQNSGSLLSPIGLVWLNGTLFVTDNSTEVIRAIDLSNPNAGFPIRTVAGQTGGQGFADCDAACLAGGRTAQFSNPWGLCTDGKTIYVMDGANHAVRQFDPVSGAVTTVVGGPNSGGPLDNPYGCVWDPATGSLYVSSETQAGASTSPDVLNGVTYVGNKIFVIH